LRGRVTEIPLKRYTDGVRICPGAGPLGRPQRSTYTEAVSWGKFVPPEEGRFADVFDGCDGGNCR